MAEYIANVSGTLTEVSGLASSAGAGDAGKIPQLDAAGRIDASMMPVGIGADGRHHRPRGVVGWGSGERVELRAGRRSARLTRRPPANVGFVPRSPTARPRPSDFWGSNTAVTGLTGRRTVPGDDRWRVASIPRRRQPGRWSSVSDGQPRRRR